jgi:hypothetical protein
MKLSSRLRLMKLSSRLGLMKLLDSVVSWIEFQLEWVYLQFDSRFTFIVTLFAV